MDKHDVAPKEESEQKNLLELINLAVIKRKEYDTLEVQNKETIVSFCNDPMGRAAVDLVIFWISKQEMMDAVGGDVHAKLAYFGGRRRNAKAPDLATMFDFEYLRTKYLSMQDKTLVESNAKILIDDFQKIREVYQEYRATCLNFEQALDEYLEKHESARADFLNMVDSELRDYVDEIMNSSIDKHISVLIDTYGFEGGVGRIRNKVLMPLKITVTGPNGETDEADVENGQEVQEEKD